MDGKEQRELLIYYLKSLQCKGKKRIRKAMFENLVMYAYQSQTIDTYEFTELRFDKPAKLREEAF
jgi:hypothetical protein